MASARRQAMLEQALRKTESETSPLFLIFALTAVLVSSMDIYVPVAPQMAILFGTTDSLMKLTFLVGPLASVVIGFAAGFFSDRYGRRPLFLGSLLLYCLGTFLCSLLPSFPLFFFGRVLQSLGVGSLLVLNTAILSDLHSGPRLARVLGLYGLVIPLTFAASPVIGAHLYTWFGWRAIFAFLFIAAAPLALLLYGWLPETCETKEKTQILPSLRKLAASKNKMVLALIHVLPMTIGILFTINGAFLYQAAYEFDAVAFSYVQAIPVVFQCLGTFIYRRVVSFTGLKTPLQIGAVLTGIFSSICFLIVMDLIQGPWAPVAAVSLFALGAAFIGTTAGTLLLDLSQGENGLAASFLSFIRNILIFAVAAGASFLPHHSPTPTFAVMLLLALAICLLIWYKNNKLLHFK